MWSKPGPSIKYGPEGVRFATERVVYTSISNHPSTLIVAFAAGTKREVGRFHYLFSVTSMHVSADDSRVVYVTNDPNGFWYGALDGVAFYDRGVPTLVRMFPDGSGVCIQVDFERYDLQVWNEGPNGAIQPAFNPDAIVRLVDRTVAHDPHYHGKIFTDVSVTMRNLIVYGSVILNEMLVWDRTGAMLERIRFDYPVTNVLSLNDGYLVLQQNGRQIRAEAFDVNFEAREVESFPPQEHSDGVDIQPYRQMIIDGVQRVVLDCFRVYLTHIAASLRQYFVPAIRPEWASALQTALVSDDDTRQRILKETMNVFVQYSYPEIPPSAVHAVRSMMIRMVVRNLRLDDRIRGAFGMLSITARFDEDLRWVSEQVIPVDIVASDFVESFQVVDRPAKVDTVQTTSQLVNNNSFITTMDRFHTRWEADFDGFRYRLKVKARFRLTMPADLWAGDWLYNTMTGDGVMLGEGLTGIESYLNRLRV